jgi:glycosyltransferase involved in cell wall biosynthesis
VQNLTSFNPIFPTKLLRVLDIMEASSVTGPAKNLLEFARLAGDANQFPVPVKIAVATFTRGNSASSNKFVQACQQTALTVHPIHERFAFDLAVIPAIRKLIAEYDPQIVQTHSVKSHFLMWLTAVYRQRYWIAFHHGYTWTNPKVILYNQLDRWSLPKASRVITVCRAFGSALSNAGVRADRIAVKHNCVKTFVPSAPERVLELRRTLRIPTGSQVLLTVGRLSREKGQSDLIQALSLLRKTNGAGELRLVIVGDGPEKQRLKEAAERYGVAESVCFVGHQLDVTSYYSMADVLVLPSHSEGSPNVLLEAMAAGLPIIATDVGGIPEIVTNEREGLLVEKNNPVALARAITRVLRNENLRDHISQIARRSASVYSSADYCDFMLSLYRGYLDKDPQTLSPKSIQQDGLLNAVHTK